MAQDNNANITNKHCIFPYQSPVEMFAKDLFLLLMRNLLSLSLAVDLAPEYGSRAAPETVAYLKSDLENIMRTNLGKILSSKIGAIPNSNIYTDQTVAGSMGPPQGVNM